MLKSIAVRLLHRPLRLLKIVALLARCFAFFVRLTRVPVTRLLPNPALIPRTLTYLGVLMLTPFHLELLDDVLLRLFAVGE